MIVDLKLKWELPIQPESQACRCGWAPQWSVWREPQVWRDCYPEPLKRQMFIRTEKNWKNSPESNQWPWRLGAKQEGISNMCKVDSEYVRLIAWAPPVKPENSSQPQMLNQLRSAELFSWCPWERRTWTETASNETVQVRTDALLHFWTCQHM